MTTKITPSTLANTAVTTGTYGGSTQHSVVTVDQQGRITYAANATPSIATTQLTGTVSNAQLTNSAVTITAGTGMSGGGSVSLGGSTTLTNAGVTSLTAGSGISVSGSTGGVTVSNSGVTSVNGSTGAVTVSSLGVSQSLGDYSGSRALNTTYTNSTGKPIVFYVSMGYGDADLLVNGINFGHSPQPGAANCVVPPGATYQANAAGGRYFNYWYEYR